MTITTKQPINTNQQQHEKTTKQAIAEYSADAMRWALADAGDALDDANFETTTANAAILRLTKELAWAEEMLAPGAGLREGGGGEATIADKVFANEIAIAVHRWVSLLILFRGREGMDGQNGQSGDQRGEEVADSYKKTHNNTTQPNNAPNNTT